MKHTSFLSSPKSTCGLTIVEILVTLLVLSVGLVLITATMPISLKSSAAAEEQATCQIIASNYISIIKAGSFYVLPNESSQEFPNSVKKVFDLPDTLATDEIPEIIRLENDDTAQIYSEPDYAVYFRDRTVSGGNYLVNISYCQSSVVPHDPEHDPGIIPYLRGRFYRVSVRREGGEWNSYFFHRCDY